MVKSDYKQFTPVATSPVRVNSIFVDSADNKMKVKNNSGVVKEV